MFSRKKYIPKSSTSSVPTAPPAPPAPPAPSPRPSSSNLITGKSRLSSTPIGSPRITKQFSAPAPSAPAPSAPALNRSQRFKQGAKKYGSSILGYARNFLIRDIILILVVIIAYYVIKYGYKLYYIRPRSYWYNSFLDTAGKFDKSTGLDLELADKLSGALTDYITTPYIVIDKIDAKLPIMINSSIDKNKQKKIVEYLRENLYKRYIVDNPLLRDLQIFVKYAPLEYNNAYDKNFATIDKDTLTDDIIKKYNSYQKEYYKEIENSNPTYTTINGDLDNPTVSRFIKEIRKLANKDKDKLVWDKSLDISVENINILFKNILETNSSSIDSITSMLEKIRNIFLRNVLYVLLKQHTKTTENQLKLIEINNILSYINPYMFNENKTGAIKAVNELLDSYGKYLNISGMNFKDILSGDGVLGLPEYLQNAINSGSESSFKNDTEIKYYIMRDIYERLSADSGTFSDGAEYYFNYLNKKDNYRELFKLMADAYQKPDTMSITQLLNTFGNGNNILTGRAKYSNGIKANTFYPETASEYYVYFTNYMQTLEYSRGSNYDSGNFVVNAKYALNEPENFKKEHKMPPHFNINMVSDADKSIIELFNYIITFDIMFAYIDKFKSNRLPAKDDIYNEIVKYYYYMEAFTSHKIFNVDAGRFVDIFDKSPEESKRVFREYFADVLNSALYYRDMNLINTAVFTSILLYDKSNPRAGTEKELLGLSKYYVSFVEIKLGQNFIRDIEKFKKYRTYFDVWDDFFIKNTNYYRKLFWNKALKIWRWNDQMYYSEFFWGKFLYFFAKFEDSILQKIGFKNKNIKTETKEHFSKSIRRIARAFANVGKFFMTAFKLLIQFSKFLTRFFKEPISVVIYFFLFMFYTLLKVIITILNINLNLSGIADDIIDDAQDEAGKRGGKFGAKFSKKADNIGTGGFSTFRVITPVILLFMVYPLLLLLTLANTIIIIITIILYFLITVMTLAVDYFIEGVTGKKGLFSKNVYRWLYSCENSPFAWYKNSRWDLENKNERGFYCQLSCGSNYRLSDNGYFCERAPTNVPYYCPQPLIYKSFIRDKIEGLTTIRSFFINDHPQLLLRDYNSQAEFIVNYKRNKKEYYESCAKNNKGDYNRIAKSICAYAHDNQDADIRKQIEGVCKQTYCTNGNYESFCYKYDTRDIDESPLTLVIGSEFKTVKFVKYTIAIMVLFSVVIYTIKLVEKSRRGELGDLDIVGDVNKSGKGFLNRGFNMYQNWRRDRLLERASKR